MAGFNINNFKGKMSELGVLKSSSVYVQISPSSQFGLNGFNSFSEFGGMYEKLQFSAEATKLPGIRLATTEIRRHGYGVIEKKPYVPIFTDLEVVFRSDAKGDIYTFFQTWMKMIINFDGRGSINSVNGVLPGQALYEVAYKENYMSTVVINLMDNNGSERIKIVLTEAYPIFLGEIPLAWQAVNDYVKIPVVFTFKDWYMENTPNRKFSEIVNPTNIINNNRPDQPFGPPLNN